MIIIYGVYLRLGKLNIWENSLCSIGIFYTISVLFIKT